jgi:folate-dependent phosphoribosylglycinamide formyltransferase PurN
MSTQEIKKEICKKCNGIMQQYKVDVIVEYGFIRIIDMKGGYNES